MILRQSSNFGGATVSGVYANRDCPQYFYIAPDPPTGGAQFERGDRQQAVKAISRQLQPARALGAGAKRDRTPRLFDRLGQEQCPVAAGSFRKRRGRKTHGGVSARQGKLA